MEVDNFKYVDNTHATDIYICRQTNQIEGG